MYSVFVQLFCCKAMLSLNFLTIFGLFFFTGALAQEVQCPQNEKAIFCYYSSWSVYREDIATFNTSHINPHICTHLIYAFAGLSIYGGIESLDTWNDMNQGGYSSFVALKEENPCLKTLLAIGGWSQGSRPYSVMVSDAGYRKAFIESVLRLLAVYGFDGLDIDWEYPTERGGIPQDRENFGMLLAEMKTVFSKWDLLLTIAVPLSTTLGEIGYDMDAINNYVDYVLVMGYDVTPTNSPVTGYSSPMSAVRTAVSFWTQNIAKEKVVLGVPAYGRTFTLLDPEQTGIGAPTNGTGLPGYYTNEGGFLSYYEVIIDLLGGGYTVVPNEEEQNYYAYFGNAWMTFELADNYEVKANYAKEVGLGGMMIWSIDADDFEPFVNETSFAVTNLVRDVLLRVD